jgi:hypothetical protein
MDITIDVALQREEKHLTWLLLCHKIESCHESRGPPRLTVIVDIHLIVLIGVNNGMRTKKWKRKSPRGHFRHAEKERTRERNMAFLRYLYRVCKKAACGMGLDIACQVGGHDERTKVSNWFVKGDLDLLDMYIDQSI